jgi:hypothetical protein
MPVFSFEKIPAPPRIEGAAQPSAGPKRRSRLARLVDRLTEMRLQAYDVNRRRQASGHSTRTTKTG